MPNLHRLEWLDTALTRPTKTSPTNLTNKYYAHLLTFKLLSLLSLDTNNYQLCTGIKSSRLTALLYIKRRVQVKLIKFQSDQL